MRLRKMDVRIRIDNNDNIITDILFLILQGTARVRHVPV